MGFAELILIGIVGLLVIGPERLPGTIRTGAMWLNRLKRSFNDIKREVEQELHNDAVMQDLRKTGEQLKLQTDSVGKEIKQATTAIVESASGDAKAGDTSKQTQPPPKSEG